MNRRFSFVAWCLAALALAMACMGAARAETITYFHNDPAGTPVVATDSAGRVAWQESYLPYGAQMNHPAAAQNNSLWFTGKPYDARTGLSYMGARYYDPLVGRFMGVDPVGFQESNVHSFNRYAYANNNPYKFVDPDGRVPVLIAAAYSGVGALVNGGINAAAQYHFTGHIQWSGIGGVLDAAGDGAILGPVAWAGARANVATRAATAESALVKGVTVTDKKAGTVLQGTVDLKPTLDRISAGKSFPHRNDGSVFGNKEGLLPSQPAGYYREYVHPTPGVSGPGPQRVVTGQGGEIFYTPNHYGSFIQVKPKSQ